MKPRIEENPTEVGEDYVPPEKKRITPKRTLEEVLQAIKEREDTGLSDEDAEDIATAEVLLPDSLAEPIPVPFVGEDHIRNEQTAPRIPNPRELFSTFPVEYQRDLEEECSEKQLNFAILIAHGVSQVQAYEYAYDVGEDTKETSKRSAANQIAKSNKIMWAVSLIKRASVTAQMLDGTGKKLGTPDVVREWVLARLAKESKDMENTGSVRVRALELLARAYDVFGERAPSENDVKLDEVEDRLQAMLSKAKILNQMNDTIPGDPDVIDVDDLTEEEM